MRAFSRRAFAAAALLIIATVASAQAPGTPSKRSKPPIVVIETERGVIKIRLFPEVTPKTVANFVKLARSGFYNGLMFHRVEPEFVVQGGDPKSKSLPVGHPELGTGNPGHTIPNEDNGPLKHNRGAVAMANSGPDSAGSQFYIVISKPAPHLDQKDARGISRYTIFGQVVEGMQVAEELKKGDRMKKVTIQ